MRARRVVFMLLVALSLPSLARAEDAREAQARSYFSVGLGKYNLGEYPAAIEAFQAGYKLKPLPLFLFNIAQAARRSGRFELAQEYYVLYLDREMTRSAPQRTEARAQLIRVRHELAIAARERRNAPPPPKPPAKLSDDEPTPTPVAPIVTPSPPPPSPSVPPATLDPALAASLTTPAVTRDAQSRPVWKRAWFWGTLGAVVVVGVGAGVGAWLAVQSRGPAKPSLGAVNF